MRMSELWKRCVPELGGDAAYNIKLQFVDLLIADAHVGARDAAPQPSEESGQGAAHAGVKAGCACR